MVNVSERRRPVTEKLGQELSLCAFRLDFDSSYPTGGEKIDLGRITGFSNILHVQVESKSGYRWDYDRVNKKLIGYTSGGTQINNATDLSALTDVGVVVYGN